MWAIPINFNIKYHPLKLFLVFYSLFVLAGCDETLNIKHQKDYKIVVTGELVAGQHSVLHFAKSGSVNSVEAPEPIDNAEASLINTMTGQQFKYRSTGNGYWVCDGLMPEVKQSYQVKISTAEKKIEGLTVIPDTFDLHAKMLEGKTKTIVLNLAGAKIIGNKFIVSLQSRTYEAGSGLSPISFTGNWENIQMYCNDEKTDNIKYKALESPYSKIFFQPVYDQEIRFSAENQEGLRKFRVIVKSVDPIYYNYVYSYECMKATFSGSANVIPLQGNINNGLGIFGGVTQKIIEL